MTFHSELFPPLNGQNGSLQDHSETTAVESSQILNFYNIDLTDAIKTGLHAFFSI